MGDTKEQTTLVSAAIQRAIRASVGDDEPVDMVQIKRDGYEAGDWDAYQRNQLRAEIRANLKEKGLLR